MERDRMWYGTWFCIGAVVGMFASDLIIREPLRQDNARLHQMLARCDSMLVACQDAQYGALGDQLDSLMGAGADTSTVYMISGAATPPDTVYTGGLER